MTDILEFPEIRHRVSPISVEQYHRLGKCNANGRRTELIRGLILEIPDRSSRYRLSAAGFRVAASVVPEGFTVRVRAPLTFRDSEPDIAIVRGSEEDYREAHPSMALLVIEVADGDGELERAMAPMYAEAGVEEYWIQVAGKAGVEVYRRPEEGVYQERMVVESGTIACLQIPEVGFKFGCWPD